MLQVRNRDQMNPEIFPAHIALNDAAMFACVPYPLLRAPCSNMKCRIH